MPAEQRREHWEGAADLFHGHCGLPPAQCCRRQSQVLLNSEPGEYSSCVRNPHDATRGDLFQPLSGYVVTADQYPSAPLDACAKNCTQCTRLPCTSSSEQRGDLSLFNFQVNIANHVTRAVRRAQVADLQQCGCHEGTVPR